MDRGHLKRRKEPFIFIFPAKMGFGERESLGALVRVRDMMEASGTRSSVCLSLGVIVACVIMCVVLVMKGGCVGYMFCDVCLCPGGFLKLCFGVSGRVKREESSDWKE